MELASEPAAKVEGNTPSGFLHDLAWFLSGAILPLGSFWFYREASRRRVGLAILFFFVFTTVITTLSTISVGIGMVGVVSQIREAFQRGTVPAITIRGGVAEVDSPQPFIIFDQQTSNGAILMAIDTTGKLTSIDSSRYDQGILITRTQLVVLNESQGPQRLPLSEINTMFGADPLVIDEESVANAWLVMSIVVAAVAFILLVLWNSIFRLMIIALLALIFWGIVSLFRRNIGFGPFIITGLYAVIPAIYLSRVFSRSEASFPGLQTILLILFWAVGLLAVLSNDKFFTGPRSPRLWTALLGIPMLIWFIVDMFANLPSPGAQIALWAIVLFTGISLAGLRLYFHFQELPKFEPVIVPPAN